MPDIFVSEKAAHTHHAHQQKQAEVKNEGPLIHFPESIKKSVHMFASFCENPGDITFKNQDKNETVILFVRRHFVTNFPWIATGIILLILPIVIGPLISILNIPIAFLPESYILFFTLFYFLFVISFMFVKFITWYFNISLVTNERVLDLDFSEIVYKNLASTTLNLVQDVSYDQTGVLRTFFHYGDVFVQTAGEKPNFDFHAVPQPENVVHIIGGLIGKNGNL